MRSSAQVDAEVTPADLQFEFCAGSVALDLVATIGERWRRGFERLSTPADLGSWLAETGLVDGTLEVSETALEDARRLRAAIYECVSARMSRRSRPPTGARRVLNDHAAAAGAVQQLDSRWSMVHVAGDPVAAALAAVARDAIELLTRTEPSRLRECAAPDCSHLYVDRSRPGRRRWCSSTGCGNRAKTAAYRERRRAAAGVA